MAKVRHAAVFLDRRRVADLQQATLTLDTNDTLEVTDGGVHATDGTTMGTLSAKVLIKVAASGLDIADKAIQKRTFKIEYGVVDGKVFNADARVKTLKFDSEVAPGKQTGDYEFLLFNIQVTG